MRQVAPDPEVLHRLVETLVYKPGWRFVLADIDRGQGSEGLTLDIITRGYDSYHPDRGENYRVHHYMPVPPAAFDERSWRRWLFEQLLLVERHEACEFFRFECDTPNRVGTEILGTNHHVERPYAPHHGPGNDPYIVFEHGSDIDVRTSFRGEVNP
jgi:hypothetical protein